MANCRLLARLLRTMGAIVAFAFVVSGAADAFATPLSLPEGFQPVEQTEFATSKNPGVDRHHVRIRDGQIDAEVVQITRNSSAAIADTARDFASAARQSGNAQEVVIHTPPGQDPQYVTIRFDVPRSGDHAGVAFVFRDGSQIGSVRVTAPRNALPDLEAKLLPQIKTIARRPNTPDTSDSERAVTLWSSALVGSLICMWALKKRKKTLTNPIPKQRDASEGE